MEENKGLTWVIPMCIYHSTKPGDYSGYIGPPSLHSEGHYECGADGLPFGRWYATFYAVSPSVRPIPLGMEVYCALRADSAPYTTTAVEYSYGLVDTTHQVLDTKSQCSYFMAYSQAAPNTVPLYLHKRADVIHPSFDKNPPPGEGWGPASGGSPIHVMTPESVQTNDPADVKFTCVNGRCLPWVKGKFDDIFGEVDLSPMDLPTCMIMCTTLAVKGKHHQSLLNEIKHTADKNKKQIAQQEVKSDDERIPVWYLALAGGVLLAAIVVVVIELAWVTKRRKHRN